MGAIDQTSDDPTGDTVERLIIQALEDQEADALYAYTRASAAIDTQRIGAVTPIGVLMPLVLNRRRIDSNEESVSLADLPPRSQKRCPDDQ